MERPTLDEVIDEALALVWMDGIHPNDVRDTLKKKLMPFLRKPRKPK